MTEGYSEHRVQVGPETWVSFAGRKVGSIPGNIYQPKGYDFTLYETPDEGLKLHVKEWAATRTTDIRPPGERATIHDWIGGELLAEEDARQKYPELLEALLRQKQDKEIEP